MLGSKLKRFFRSFKNTLSVPCESPALMPPPSGPEKDSLLSLISRSRETRGIALFPRGEKWHVMPQGRRHYIAKELVGEGFLVVYDCCGAREEVKGGLEEISPKLFLFSGPFNNLHILPKPLL